MPIKIVIAFPQPLYRRAFVSLLQARPGFDVCAQTATTEETLSAVRMHQPDILILHLSAADANPFEVLEILQKEKAEVKIIAISSHSHKHNVVRGLELGVKGFLLACSETDDPHAAIEKVMEGGSYFNGQCFDALLKEVAHIKRYVPHFNDGTVDFDADEMKLLRAYALQYTREKLWSEACTCKSNGNRRKNDMMKKIGADDFLGVFIYALQKGILNLDEIPILQKEEEVKKKKK